MNFLKNKTLLITGGTGSFGNAAVEYLLKKSKFKKIIIFSRDENKQYLMQNRFRDQRLRFFIGDVRDEDRLLMAFRNVDFVIHAAAQKHVPSAEYNPIECIKTNVNGAQSIISAAIKSEVKKVINLSTDKACNPINLYGASKLCAEKLFINANQLAGKLETKFSTVRYGNVIASRGSVIPLFVDLSRQKNTKIPLTHKSMTRFFITLEQAVNFVISSLDNMIGGEIFIPKMHSIFIDQLIKIINPKAKVKIIGIRPGEKIHETLFSTNESKLIYDNGKFYVIYSENFSKIKKNEKKLAKNLNYSSDLKTNLNPKKIEQLIKKLKLI